MKVVEVEGSPFEMGFQQGEFLKEDIERAYKTYVSTPYFKNAKPWFLPFGIFEKIAKKKALKTIEDLLKFTPRMKERFDGLAKGGGIDKGNLALMHAGEVLLNKVDYTLGSCTGIAILPERSKDGKILVLKNFDYPVEFKPYNLLRISKPNGGFKSVDFTMIPIVGSHDSMNERGLVILYNYGLSIEDGKEGPLITALVQETLEECDNVDCALKKFEGRKYPSSAIIMLADPKSAVVLEITPKHFGVREPKNGYIVMTNHFRTNEVKPYDIPSNAVFSRKAIKELRGVRIHQSDELRYERAVELIENFEKIGLDEAMNILRDHGEGENPSDDTICRHAYPYSTIGSVIFLPHERKVLYRSGNPCEGEYEEMVM